MCILFNKANSYVLRALRAKNVGVPYVPCMPYVQIILGALRLLSV